MPVAGHRISRMKSWLSPRLYPLVKIVHPWLARLQRPLTMGVRAMIFDEAGRICLIRHGYVAGWHLPGGGVEPRETLLDSLHRETREETGLAILDEPDLFGLYFNPVMGRRDHVALYIVRRTEQTSTRPSSFEIVEQGFFAPDALPEGTTGPTRRRIAEVLERRRPDVRW